MKRIILPSLILLFFMSGCSNRNDLSDAYGNFEVKELLISAEIPGKILQFKIEEGMKLNTGDTVGFIDSIPFHLQKEQLKAAIDAVHTKKINVRAQVDVYEEQKRTLLVEKNRLERLLKDGAATAQQMDQIEGQLRTLDSQIRAAETQFAGIESEISSIITQINQVEDKIRRCLIINPIDGTILEKYAEPFEIAAAGRTLYKIANLETMELRAYISGEQLPHVKLGHEVTVLIDQDAKTNRELKGVVSWISDKSEFTPKIIQTKEERVNLVYAIKIQVRNDGTIKIGMPGEVKF
jgi:HlyD family secretion protein